MRGDPDRVCFTSNFGGPEKGGRLVGGGPEIEERGGGAVDGGGPGGKNGEEVGGPGNEACRVLGSGPVGGP